MQIINVSVLRTGGIRSVYRFATDEHGFALNFTLANVYPASRVHQAFASYLQNAKITWIKPHRHFCEVDLDGARQQFSDTLKAQWIRGRVAVEPEIAESPAETRGLVNSNTKITLRFLREEVILNQQRRIFLSHKSANKDMVRRFYDVLAELGFDPWLDKEDIVLGDNLHRVLDAGMSSSCAAVFFITPEFRDETFLEYEMNLAMREKTARAERFNIITLSLAGSNGQRGNVPQILRTFTFGELNSELEALHEIIRALPLRVGPVEWRR